MSTIADKLNLLIKTKEDIRLAINKKGVSCGTGVAFSSYPSKIMQIDGGGGGDNLLLAATLRIYGYKTYRNVSVNETNMFRFEYYKINLNVEMKNVTALSLSVTEG